MIKRLRPAWPVEKFSAIYAEAYDHTKWEEHVKRVLWTVDQINTLALPHITVPIVADLSCGDGAILRGLNVQQRVYGDMVWAPHVNIVGPIEQTIETTVFDMLVCTETLEHLDDPRTFLKQVRSRARYAVFTTPLGEFDSDKNEEHYWGWDEVGLESLFLEASLTPRQFSVLECPWYTYQLWVVQSDETQTWVRT